MKKCQGTMQSSIHKSKEALQKTGSLRGQKLRVVPLVWDGQDLALWRTVGSCTKSRKTQKEEILDEGQSVGVEGWKGSGGHSQSLSWQSRGAKQG